jgi:hypothetical protein
MQPRLDPRPASRFHAVKPRHVKIVTNLHERLSGITWDLPANLSYIAHHANDLGHWGTVDAESLRIPIHVAAHDERRIRLEPAQVLRLVVLQ